MRNLLLGVFMLLALNVKAQWVVKDIDSPFDGNFSRAYVLGSNDRVGILILEADDHSQPELFLFANFVCEDRMEVDMSFYVNGQKNIYSFTGFSFKDNKYVAIMDDDYWSVIKDDFIKSSKVYIRVNDGSCGSKVFEFNMRGSANALVNYPPTQSDGMGFKPE